MQYKYSWIRQLRIAVKKFIRKKWGLFQTSYSNLRSVNGY